jgi:hypothetical protein
MTSQQLFLRDYGLPAPTTLSYMVIGGGGNGAPSAYSSNKVGGGGSGAAIGGTENGGGTIAISKGTTYSVSVGGATGTTNFGNLLSAGGGYSANGQDGANSPAGWGGSNGDYNCGGGGAGSRTNAFPIDANNGAGGDGGGGNPFQNTPGAPGGGGVAGWYYAGGGGGGGTSIGGLGNDGGGSGGNYQHITGYDATVYGSGGGGALYDGENGGNAGGGAGGQGFVLIYYSQNLALPNSVNGATTGTSGGYRYYRWTGAGSITW